jgi:hypothetical protein
VKAAGVFNYLAANIQIMFLFFLLIKTIFAAPLVKAVRSFGDAGEEQLCFILKLLFKSDFHGSRQFDSAYPH